MTRAQAPPKVAEAASWSRKMGWMAGCLSVLTERPKSNFMSNPLISTCSLCIFFKALHGLNTTQLQATFCHGLSFLKVQSKSFHISTWTHCSFFPYLQVWQKMEGGSGIPVSLKKTAKTGIQMGKPSTAYKWLNSSKGSCNNKSWMPSIPVIMLKLHLIICFSYFTTHILTP